MTGKRKDRNQVEIESALRSVGAHVIDMTPHPKAGFDLLVVFRGHTYIAEVKDPLQPPSARKLTDGELTRKAEVEGRSVKYNILMSVDDALQMVGVKI